MNGDLLVALEENSRSHQNLKDVYLGNHDYLSLLMFQSGPKSGLKAARLTNNSHPALYV